MDLNTQKALNKLQTSYIRKHLVFNSTYTFLNIYTPKRFNTAYVKTNFVTVEILSDPLKTNVKKDSFCLFCAS